MITSKRLLLRISHKLENFVGGLPLPEEEEPRLQMFAHGAGEKSRLAAFLLVAVVSITLMPTAFFSGQTDAPVPATGASRPRQPAYPSKASDNHRYLVTQNNVPVLLVGDSPHSLIVNLSPSQANDYFANRAAYGINVLWIEVLNNAYTAGRDDGSTYDGIIPFTTPGDLSTPNEEYFKRVDTMVKLAGTYGITVLLDSFETAGWSSVLYANGATKAYNYGVYLGNRYKNFKNVIWITGNDFQYWTDSIGNSYVEAIMRGIANSDPKHIQTTQLSYPVSGSLDDSLLIPYTKLAGAYTYYPTYAEVLNQYNAAPTTPVFMEEANYEFEDNLGTGPGTPAILRRQEYWSMLSGAAGQLYGNYNTWRFPSGWQNYLDTPGAAQLKIMGDFFRSRTWWDLVPDQAHHLVTSGYGTFANIGGLGSNDFVTAARLPDGSLALAYCPTGTTITVDMTNMKGLTLARWFDPSNGTYTGISSSLSNLGLQDFRTPGSNSSGDMDWVLVLEAK